MNLKTFFILLILTFLSHNTFAVRNGIPTSIENNVVTLEIHEEFSCTGLRISKDYVITAAHCMLSKPTFSNHTFKKNVVIKYKDNGKQKTYKTRTQNAILKGKTRAEDIAILKISSKNKNFTAPIISLDSSDLYLSNYKFYGYGFTSTKNNFKLRHGTLDFLTTEIDSGYITLIMKPGVDDQHPCPGDSGGPLFTKDGKVLGIVSTVETKKGLSHKPKSQCKYADKAVFIYLKEHMDFLKPYL